MRAKEVISNYFKAITEGRFEDAMKYKSPGEKSWISGEGSWKFGGWQTPEKQAAVFTLLRERFPKGLTITVRSILAEGNNAAVHINNLAERVDGRVYNNEIVFLMKVENDLIVETSEFLDTIHVNDLFCGALQTK